MASTRPWLFQLLYPRLALSVSSPIPSQHPPSGPVCGVGTGCSLCLCFLLWKLGFSEYPPHLPFHTCPSLSSRYFLSESFLGRLVLGRESGGGCEENEGIACGSFKGTHLTSSIFSLCWFPCSPSSTFLNLLPLSPLQTCLGLSFSLPCSPSFLFLSSLEQAL